MKRVLLLGDSIRMGYDDYVRDLLQGKAEVYYEAEDNSRFAAYTLWQVKKIFRDHGDFDVIHWNNGYWDMNVEAPIGEAMHPLGEYLHYLGRILEDCRRHGAQVIFATTTPIWEGASPRDPAVQKAYKNYSDEWVRLYNDAAKALMAKERVPINDLYALCRQDPQCYKCADLLHLTDEGYRACAAQVAACIERYL